MSLDSLHEAGMIMTGLERGMEPRGNPCGPLQETSERWAIHALRTFRGDTLTRALAISQAITELVADIESGVSR